MKQADKRALEAYPIDSYEGYDDMYRQRGAFVKGYEQAEKDFMEKAVEWLNSCLDNGCWVANDLCDYDKKAIVQSFKEMMSE